MNQLASASTSFFLPPREGLHLLHLFWKADSELWQSFSNEQKKSALKNMENLLEEIGSTEATQYRLFSVVSAKADLGCMLITANLDTLDRWSKRLENILGAGILTSTFSWLSMTEKSEYMRSEEEFLNEMRQEGVEEGSISWQEKLSTFHEHSQRYSEQRLYPTFPSSEEWPLICFYPMSKRRSATQNWYRLPLSERKKLMQGHAKVGRSYAGKIKQLISGSTGLDDQEWGVSLFAKNSSDIKDIVYEMRFDEVSFEYAEFGEFFIGITTTPEDWMKKMCWDS